LGGAERLAIGGVDFGPAVGVTQIAFGNGGEAFAGLHGVGANVGVERGRGAYGGRAGGHVVADAEGVACADVGEFAIGTGVLLLGLAHLSGEVGVLRGESVVDRKLLAVAFAVGGKLAGNAVEIGLRIHELETSFGERVGAGSGVGFGIGDGDLSGGEIGPQRGELVLEVGDRGIVGGGVELGCGEGLARGAELGFDGGEGAEGIGEFGLVGVGLGGDDGRAQGQCLGFGGFIGGREFGIEAGNFGLCDLEIFGGGGYLGELLTKRGNLRFEGWGAVSGDGLKLVALSGDGGELPAGAGEFRVESRDFVLGDLKVVGRGSGLGEVGAEGLVLVGARSELSAELGDLGGEGGSGGVGRVGLGGEDGLELIALLFDRGELFARGDELPLGDGGAVVVAVGGEAGFGESGAVGGEFGGNGSGFGFALEQGLLELGVALMGSG